MLLSPLSSLVPRQIIYRSTQSFLRFSVGSGSKQVRNHHSLVTSKFYSQLNHSYQFTTQGEGRKFSSSHIKIERFTKNKTTNFALFLLGIFLFPHPHCYAAEKNTIQNKTESESTLPAILNAKVLEAIQHTNDIPGLQSQELSALNTWRNLYKHGVLEGADTDKDIRPCFATLQAVIGPILVSELSKTIKTLTAVIHTPMPAPPLGVDSPIESDLNRIFAESIVRDYLGKGKSEYDKRTEEQQILFCQSIPSELSGSTYFFQDSSGNTYIFAIRMTQAKNPQDVCNYNLWFGSMNLPPIKARVQAAVSDIERKAVRL